VAAFAYVLLPVTGLVAFLKGPSSRMRFHGLQAIVLGAAWPLLLYAATWITTVVTQVVFAVGLLVWMIFIIATAVGRDPGLPLIAGRLRTVAETPVAGDAVGTVR
jgi:uncharacterized membrane protein